MRARRDTHVPEVWSLPDVHAFRWILGQIEFCKELALMPPGTSRSDRKRVSMTYCFSMRWVSRSSVRRSFSTGRSSMTVYTCVCACCLLGTTTLRLVQIIPSHARLQKHYQQYSCSVCQVRLRARFKVF